MFRAHLNLLLCCSLMVAPAYGVNSPDDDAILAVAAAIAKILPEHVKALVSGDKDKKWVSITWDVPFLKYQDGFNLHEIPPPTKCADPIFINVCRQTTMAEIYGIKARYYEALKESVYWRQILAAKPRTDEKSWALGAPDQWLNGYLPVTGERDAQIADFNRFIKDVYCPARENLQRCPNGFLIGQPIQIHCRTEWWGVSFPDKDDEMVIKSVLAAIKALCVTVE
jgi:hypothetical protein